MKLNSLLASNCNPINKIKICKNGIDEEKGEIWKGDAASLEVKYKQVRVVNWYIDFLQYPTHTDVLLVAFVK